MFNNKYSYVFTPNTKCSQGVPDLGVITELLNVRTYTQILGYESVLGSLKQILTTH